MAFDPSVEARVRRLQWVLLPSFALALGAMVLCVVCNGVHSPSSQFGPTPWGVATIAVLHFAIAILVLRREPAIGAGFVLMSAITTTVLLGAASAFLGIFIGIGWGGSGPTSSERFWLESTLAGLAISLVFLVTASRYAWLRTRTHGFGHVMVGGLIGFAVPALASQALLALLML